MINTEKHNQQGLTIIELLIVIPIASLIIVVLFGAMFNQYTLVLAESARSNLRSSGQTLLINLQDELLFTIAYGETMESALNDPNDPPSGWSYNSDPQTLIINEIALDSTRRDDNRHIVRQRLNACESSAVTANPVAVNNVIYFVADNPDSQYSTLYKRTVVPSYATCSIDSVTDDPCTPGTATCLDITKKTSCPASEIGSNGCSVKDSVLSENIIDMQIEYFAEGNVATTFPSSADKIEITLSLGDTVYGKEVTTEVKHTIRKIN